MFKAVELPTRVSNLNTSLTNVDAKTLSHLDNFRKYLLFCIEIIWVEIPPVTCRFSPETDS